MTVKTAAHIIIVIFVQFYNAGEGKGKKVNPVLAIALLT